MSTSSSISGEESIRFLFRVGILLLTDVERSTWAVPDLDLNIRMGRLSSMASCAANAASWSKLSFFACARVDMNGVAVEETIGRLLDDRVRTVGGFDGLTLERNRGVPFVRS